MAPTVKTQIGASFLDRDPRSKGRVIRITGYDIPSGRYEYRTMIPSVFDGVLVPLGRHGYLKPKTLSTRFTKV